MQGSNPEDHDRPNFTVLSALPHSSNHTPAIANGSDGFLPLLSAPLLRFQQIPKLSHCASVSDGGIRSAALVTNHTKRKGAPSGCSCSGVQCCQLHRAQANFRKSLRRGFLSPFSSKRGTDTASASDMKGAQLCNITRGPSHVADLDLEVLPAIAINLN